MLVSSAGMEIFDGHRALFRPLFDPAIALGNFDGVHRGHQRLLSETRTAAAQLGGDAAVLTFEPHPARLLAPAVAPPLITARSRKLELLAAAGISACIVEPFTRELAALGPDQFLQEIVVDVIRARHVIVGYDFTYGYQRSGTTDTLREFGDRHGFEVTVVEPVSVGGVVASSSVVREFLRRGDLDGAGRILGRAFDIDGRVVRGAGRGRTIGIPTANLRVENDLVLPKPGVYAVRAHILDGGPRDPGSTGLPGVANLGTSPTFTDGQALSLEVHLLDLGPEDGDLYDRCLRVEFIARLRDEVRFSGVEALLAQIRADIEKARGILDSPSAS